jgi:hypothetical protein
MVVECVGDDPNAALDGAITGLVLDQWTEVVPRRLMKTDLKQPDEPPTYSDVTTSAVAVNANAPGARPPQAILLALSADGAAWDDDRLVKVSTRPAPARMRTLTLRQIPSAACCRLYFRDWSLQGRPVIDWVKVTTTFVQPGLKFLSIRSETMPFGFITHDGTLPWRHALADPPTGPGWSREHRRSTAGTGECTIRSG